jgi:hypothetical protein
MHRVSRNATLAVWGVLLFSVWAPSTFSLSERNATAKFQRTARVVADHLAWVQIGSGSSHTCGIATLNRAYCWGSNEEG